MESPSRLVVLSSVFVTYIYICVILVWLFLPFLCVYIYIRETKPARFLIVLFLVYIYIYIYIYISIYPSIHIYIYPSNFFQTLGEEGNSKRLTDFVRQVFISFLFCIDLSVCCVVKGNICPDIAHWFVLHTWKSFLFNLLCLLIFIFLNASSHLCFRSKHTRG